MLSKTNKFFPVTIIAGLAFLCLTSETQAQIEDITFTRNSTSDLMVSEIEFQFGVPADAEDVFIDQLGATTALLQNNDGIGQELFLEVAGPIDSIGLVGIGDVLNAGDVFDETDFLDLGPLATIGDDVFVGFNSSGDVGYFTVSFDLDTQSIFYSSGSFGSGGESLSVAAVPEPSAVLILALAGAVTTTRRRRQ